MAEQALSLEDTGTRTMFEQGVVAGAAKAVLANPSSAGVVERSPALLRQVNEVMRDERRGLAEQERIPFFCECDRSDCYKPVWLTGEMYDERRAEERHALILPGHEVASGVA